jgi:hypothetical protein
MDSYQGRNHCRFRIEQRRTTRIESRSQSREPSCCRNWCWWCCEQREEGQEGGNEQGKTPSSFETRRRNCIDFKGICRRCSSSRQATTNRCSPIQLARNRHQHFRFFPLDVYFRFSQHQ